MTQPDNCGSKGGAISVWQRVIDCPVLGAFVSSQPRPLTTGSTIYCVQSRVT